MNAISFPVVHPAFRNLRFSGRLLHLTAGGLILTHALTHFRQHENNPLYFWCLLIIALDIFVLVFAVRNMLADMPRVNLFFRLVEVIFFMGIGITMYFEYQWVLGSIHVVLSFAYGYLFYCEKKLQHQEHIDLFHTGVSVPGLPDDKFFIWSHIDRIDIHQDSVTIDTSRQKSYHFNLRKTLDAEELEQIHEFCRHYLGESA